MQIGIIKRGSCGEQTGVCDVLPLVAGYTAEAEQKCCSAGGRRAIDCFGGQRRIRIRHYLPFIYLS